MASLKPGDLLVLGSGKIDLGHIEAGCGHFFASGKKDVTSMFINNSSDFASFMILLDDMFGVKSKKFELPSGKPAYQITSARFKTQRRIE